MVPEAARVAVSVDGGVAVEEAAGALDSVVAAVTSHFCPLHVHRGYSRELCLLSRILVYGSTT